jgi:outer membrane protein
MAKKHTGLLAFWILCLIGASFSRPVWAGDPVVLSYDQLPQLVKERNSLVQSWGKQSIAANERRASLGRSFLPHVQAEGGYESFKTGPYPERSQPYGSAEIRANLFRGGRDAAEEKMRAGQSDLVQANSQRAERDELATARRYYWELVFNRAMAKVLADAIDGNHKNVRSVERRIQRGLTTSTDRVEFELHGLQLEESLHSYEHEIVIIETSLAPILGYPVGTKFETGTFPKASEVNLEAQLTGVNPDVSAANANKRIAAAQARESRVLLRPSLDLYGGYYLYTLRDRDFVDRSERDDTAAGVQLTIPIFDGFQSARIARAFSEQASAYESLAFYNEAKGIAEIERKREELKHEQELIRSSERQADLVKKYLRGTLDEYDRGVKNAPDVTGAMERSISIQQQLMERRREYQYVQLELLRLVEK